MTTTTPSLDVDDIGRPLDPAQCCSDTGRRRLRRLHRHPARTTSANDGAGHWTADGACDDTGDSRRRTTTPSSDVDEVTPQHPSQCQDLDTDSCGAGGRRLSRRICANDGVDDDDDNDGICWMSDDSDSDGDGYPNV